MTKRTKYTVGFSVLILTIMFGCNSRQKKEQLDNQVGLDKKIGFPFFSTDSVVTKNNTLILYFTDSLPFFNPIINGQAVAIKCAQLDNKNESFDKVLINNHMPLREDGDIQGSFSKSDYDKIMGVYFRPELYDFYDDLLHLNWSTKDNYSKNFMTLLDRINMTFQKSIKANYATDFPNGSDWYGFNSFIVFNKYYDELKDNEIGAAHKVINSIYENPDPYISEIDKKKLIDLIGKHLK